MRSNALSRMNGVLFGLFLVVVATIVRAQDPRSEPRRIQPTSATAVSPTGQVPIVSSSQVAATPEMWFYEQNLRRYDDPKNAVRAAAEFQASQRRARIAAMHWYGYSNSRPSWGIDPVHGTLQPQWIGNSYNPSTWVAPSNTTWAMPSSGAGY